MLPSWAPHFLLFPCKEGAGRATYLCPCPLSLVITLISPSQQCAAVKIHSPVTIWPPQNFKQEYITPWANEYTLTEVKIKKKIY